MNIIDGPNTDFAMRLNDLRRQKGITQDELAKSIGTDKRSISTYETGRTFPREDTLRRLATFFDVEPLWLTTRNSQEVRQYLKDQRQNIENENSLKRVELLYIESWDKVGDDTRFKRTLYAEEPSCGRHSSDISLFIPVINGFHQQYRAIKVPFDHGKITSYTKGAIVIIDEGATYLDSIPSGSDVIFRLAGKENEPGLRKLIRESGMEPKLESLDPYSRSPSVSISELNIEILGVVIGIFNPI